MLRCPILRTDFFSTVTRDYSVVNLNLGEMLIRFTAASQRVMLTSGVNPADINVCKTNATVEMNFFDGVYSGSGVTVRNN